MRSFSLLPLFPFLSTVVDLVSALPRPSSMPIPLRKRASLTVNGTFDLDAACAHVAQTESKILSGFRVLGLEPSAGAPHFPKGAISDADRRNVVGSDTLTPGASNVYWYGTVSVGNPPVDFLVDFDTGSADMVLPSTSCNTTCSGHTLYDPAKSATAVDRNHTFTFTYGDGSFIKGEQYADTVTVAGYTADNQALGGASEYSTHLQSPTFTADGLLGMAFETLSEFGSPPVVQTLVDSGALSEPVFAFKLAPAGSQSELRIGSVNTALFAGSLTYTPVTVKGFWQIEGDGISANGKTLVPGFSAIVDTGTTLILSDANTVSQFYGGLNATSVGNGFYTFPCDAVPSVSISIGGKPFPMSAETFNLGSYPAGGSGCVGAIVGSGSLGNTMVLGDAFLRNTYTVFDVGQTRVGFADLA